MTKEENKNNTLDEWSAKGLNQKNGQQFAQDVSQINTLKLFIRALPSWSKKHNTSVLLKVSSKPEWDGVGIEFGFDKKKLSPSQADSLTERLIDTSRLMELEFLVENMRGLGVSVDIINKLVEEADDLAKKLKN